MKKTAMLFCTAMVVLVSVVCCSKLLEPTPVCRMPASHILQPYTELPLYERVKELFVGEYREYPPRDSLDEIQRAALWQLLRINEWTVADEIPERVLPRSFTIREGIHYWFFSEYEGKMLVVPSMSDEQGEKICYFAPKEIIDEVLEFAKTLSDYQQDEGEQAYTAYPLYERVNALVVGGGMWEDPPAHPLDEQQRAALWALLRVDDWTVATGLPAHGFSSKFFILEGEQSWFFNEYEGKILIVPSRPNEQGEKICYFAPLEVLAEVSAFAETLPAYQQGESK